jgi:hypothetical protein
MCMFLLSEMLTQHHFTAPYQISLLASAPTVFDPARSKLHITLTSYQIQHLILIPCSTPLTQGIYLLNIQT